MTNTTNANTTRFFPTVKLGDVQHGCVLVAHAGRNDRTGAKVHIADARLSADGRLWVGSTNCSSNGHLQGSLVKGGQSFATATCKKCARPANWAAEWDAKSVILQADGSRRSVDARGTSSTTWSPVVEAPDTPAPVVVEAPAQAAALVNVTTVYADGRSCQFRHVTPVELGYLKANSAKGDSAADMLIVGRDGGAFVEVFALTEAGQWAPAHVVLQ